MSEILIARSDIEVGGTDARVTHTPATDLEALCEVAATVLVGEGVEAGRLDLHLVDEADIAALNAEHMGKTGPTDVLSFPLDLDDAVGPVMLGDVVLCPAVAERQAPEHVGEFVGEVQLLTIHGVLHVLGHDHAEPDETAEMVTRERHYLDALGVAHPGAAS